MYLLPADPQMVRAMDQLITGNPHVFTYSHPNSKNRLLINVLAEVLEKGRSMLMVVPDKVDSNEFSSYVNSSIFKPYCLYIKDTEDINAEVIRNILLEDSIPSQTLEFEDFTLMKARMMSKLEGMNQAYSSINSQVIQNRTWKDLLQYVDNTEPPDVYQSFVNKIDESGLIVSYQTYAEVRLFLEEIEPFYREDFKFLVENDLLNYNSKFNYSEWTEKMKSYSEITKECIYDLNLFVDNYSRENQNQALKDIQRYELLIEKIREDIGEYRLHHGALLLRNNKTISNVVRRKFNADYKSKLNKSNELRMIIDLLLEDLNSSAFFSFKMSTLSQDKSTLEDYEFWLDRVVRHFENWKSDLKEYNSNHIKQLNCQNTALPDLKHIDKRIKNILKDINANNYLTKAYEDNTFSVLKKIEFVRQLDYDISKSLWRLENYQEYVTFRVKLAKQTSKEKELVDLVTQYDQADWISLLDYFYLHTAVYQNANSSMPQNNGAAEGYLDSLKSYRKTKIEKIHNYTSHRRKVAVDNLKNSDSELYKMLSNPSNKVYNNWIDILLNHHTSLIEIFPLMIIKESVFKKTKLQSHLQWHQVWVDNMTQFLTIDLDKISKISKWQCFTSMKSLGKKEIERLAYLSNGNQPLQQHNIDALYNKEVPSFKKLKHADRLNAAKQVNSQLDFASHKLRIFQLRDITILSYFSDFLNNQLIGFLENKGLKEIIPNKEIDYGLTDVLVSANHDIVVCQEDGVFDMDQLVHMEWQHTMTNKLVKMGFHHINIWSADIFMKNPYYVRRTFYKIFDKINQPMHNLAVDYDKS